MVYKKIRKYWKKYKKYGRKMKYKRGYKGKYRKYKYKFKKAVIKALKNRPKPELKYINKPAIDIKDTTLNGYL